MNSAALNDLHKDLGNLSAYQKALFVQVKARFDAIKSIMMSQFDSHPVTVELKGGENSENVSGTLNGYGNLYSFLGFTSDPISPLRQAIETMCAIQAGMSQNGKDLTFSFNVPDYTDLTPVGSLPWAFGGNWMEGIEKGIPNGYSFLYDERGNSRSGGGIQVETRLRDADFSPIPYLTPIFSELKSSLSRI